MADGEVTSDAKIDALLARIEQLESERGVARAVADLDAKVERLMAMVCPHCGPKIVAELHPETREEVRDVARAITRPAAEHRNGHR